MITGVPPFYHKNKKKMYYLIKEAPLRFPDPIKHGVSVSDEAKDLITKVGTFESVRSQPLVCAAADEEQGRAHRQREGRRRDYLAPLLCEHQREEAVEQRGRRVRVRAWRACRSSRPSCLTWGTT